MNTPNRRPLVARPKTRLERLFYMARQTVTNGTALVALSLAVVILAGAVFVLQNSVTAARHERDVAQGATDCRSRIGSQVQAVESARDNEVAKALLALKEGDEAAGDAASKNIKQLLVVLDTVQPLREQALNICAENPNFRLVVPAYPGQA